MWIIICNIRLFSDVSDIMFSGYVGTWRRVSWQPHFTVCLQSDSSIGGWNWKMLKTPRGKHPFWHKGKSILYSTDSLLGHLLPIQIMAIELDWSDLVWLGFSKACWTSCWETPIPEEEINWSVQVTLSAPQLAAKYSNPVCLQYQLPDTNCQAKCFLSNLEHLVSDRTDVVKALDFNTVVCFGRQTNSFLWH